MNKKNEIQVVNDAIQYWKGFLDALSQLNSISGEANFEEKYKSLVESSSKLVDDYKERYMLLKRTSGVKKNNENRKSKRS